MNRMKLFFALVVTTNGFGLNHGKILQIYFCVSAKQKKKKKKKKNDFLKDVKSTVV